MCVCQAPSEVRDRSSPNPLGRTSNYFEGLAQLNSCASSWRYFFTSALRVVELFDPLLSYIRSRIFSLSVDRVEARFRKKHCKLSGRVRDAPTNYTNIGPNSESIAHCSFASTHASLPQVKHRHHTPLAPSRQSRKDAPEQSPAPETNGTCASQHSKQRPLAPRHQTRQNAPTVTTSSSNRTFAMRRAITSTSNRTPSSTPNRMPLTPGRQSCKTATSTST